MKEKGWRRRRGRGEKERGERVLVILQHRFGIPGQTHRTSSSSPTSHFRTRKLIYLRVRRSHTIFGESKNITKRGRERRGKQE